MVSDFADIVPDSGSPAVPDFADIVPDSGSPAVPDSSAAPAKFAAALPSTMCSFFIFALSASVSIEPNISAAIPMNANQHAQPSL